jgi:hypothetical protein
MKKLIMIVAVGASVLATPAFAQSFNPGFGTGNALPFSYGPIASQNVNTATSRPSGRPLYDMVQSAPTSLNSSAPAANGGGSLGYNEMLAIH